MRYLRRSLGFALVRTNSICMMIRAMTAVDPSTVTAITELVV